MKKILVVEDEPITADTISAQLGQLGYIVTDMVLSGAEAIASVLRSPPDLVLMDINLGQQDLDGVAIAAQLKSQFRLPVIYLTGRSDEVTLTRAKATEPFGFIIKPFTERDLRVAIETALYKHQAEQELWTRSLMLETILSATDDSVVATDHAATVTYMNPAAEALTGWSLAEATTQSIQNVVHFVDASNGQLAPHPATEVLRKGKVIYLADNISLVAKNGKHRSVGDSASPITKNGLVAGVVMVMWPIRSGRSKDTPHPPPEGSLIQASELDRREVLAAENDLEDLKVRFVNMASHEFRTPLSVILLAAETLESFGNNWTQDKQIRRIHRIKAAVKYLTKLLDNVFTLGKVKSDESEFQPVEINPEQFCRDLIAEFQVAQEIDPESPNQINLIFTVSGKCERASIDQKLLKQILTHLLSNATKFSGESDTIWFDLKSTDRVAEFTIRDRGIGISEADLAHVFEPFYRSNHASLIPGMGLGLSIAKHFATMHGGEISFTSVEHQGSTFTFRLPLDQE